MEPGIYLCFPYLVSITTTNYYMLRKNNASMNSILGLYDSVHNTDVGAILYAPLFVVHFIISGDHSFKVIWTFVVFSIAILFFYWVLRFLVSNISKFRSA
jgi:hypothetical protein